jgi:AcrR family transcriptional regulator
VTREMAAPTAQRPLRADARRNREALLENAAAAFAESGTDTSLEDIARRAGVGIGTLYRHFATRDALVEAVYRREVELVCDEAPALLATRSPDVALREWMQRFVDYVAIKRGMSAALKSAVGGNSELFEYTHARLMNAVTVLLDAATAAGAIRPDVDARDLMRAISGICLACTDDVREQQTRRMVALLMDGLRFGAPAVASS